MRLNSLLMCGVVRSLTMLTHFSTMLFNQRRETANALHLLFQLFEWNELHLLAKRKGIDPSRRA